MGPIIDITPIFRKYYQSLIEDSSKKFVITFFFIIPGAISTILVYSNVLISATILGILITAFSIFVGFGINVLIILVVNKDKILRNTENKLVKEIRQEFFEHFTYAALYSVILGVIIVIYLIFITILYGIFNSIALSISSGIAYALLGNFLLTFFVIAKKLYAVTHHQIKNEDKIS